MDTSFWHQRWANNHIGFHESEANLLLVKYFDELSLAKNGRVFVPLCGKTRDIFWLLSKGYLIAGVELSELAVEQLFIELGVEPTITMVGKLKRFSSENIDIFVGDILELSRDIIGSVDAIYDRAALVALPEDMRNRYAEHLIEITDNSPQLLVCYEYDQALMDGPPFSIVSEEMHQLYSVSYDLRLIASVNIPGGLHGKYVAKESVWLLL